MKKLIAFALTAVMVISISACGGKSGTSSAPSAAASGSSAASSAVSTFPQRPIELVACYGPGGGHDIMLRTALKVINAENLAHGAVMNVVNKEGGSGAVGMGYVNTHAGDDYYLMCVTSSFLTTPLSTNTGVTYKDFTPIACLGIDPSIIVVHKDSGITSMEQLLSAPRTAGGTGTGSIDNIICNKLIDTSKQDINYIPYQGDGELVTALLGKQVDFICTNINSCSEYLATGDFIGIGLATAERNEELPNIPTLIEQGYDINLGVFRGIAAPKGISEEAKQYYMGLFTELSETNSWNEQYLRANGVQKNLLLGDDFGKYLETLNGEYETAMKEMGLI